MARSPLFHAFVRALQTARRENLQARGLPSPINKHQLDWSRRRFVSSALVAGGLAAVSTKLPATPQFVSTKQKRPIPQVAVIGGGIAGLNAAYQLKKAGLQATVYEASRRLGGRIFTGQALVGDDLTTELGGEFINTNHNDMLILVQEFGLKLFNRVEDAAKSSIPTVGFFFNGQSHSEVDIANLLRPLAAQIDSDAGLIDKNYEGYAPQFDSLSVSDYLEQHSTLIPEPFIRKLIENAIRTEFGVEPEESSALQLLFNLPTVDGQRVEMVGNSDETFVIEGGNSKLIKGLAQELELDNQIHTGMPLTRLEYLRGRRFRLTFKNGETTDADYVILAIPFTALRNIALEIALPRKLQRFINESNLGKNEKFIAGFDKKVWRNSGGFYGEAWSDLGFSLVWDATQRQFNRKDGALTFFLSAKEVTTTKALFKNNDLLGKVFIGRLNKFIPGSAKAATGKFIRTQWTRNPWTQGAYTSFSPGQRTRFAEYFWIESDTPAQRQEVRVENLLFAGEHVSDEYFGFMNGGAQTGRLAAETVLKSVVKDLTGKKSEHL